MKIYINENYEIKAINHSNDESLTEIEIDRKEVFGNATDYFILNHCYVPEEHGYTTYYAGKNYEEAVKIDYYTRTKILEEEVSLQDEIIANLTYEVMMSYENTTYNINKGSYSPKFNLIKRYYFKNFWTDKMVQNMVEKGQITQEECNEILNK